MTTSLLKNLFLVFLLSACASSKNNKPVEIPDNLQEVAPNQVLVTPDAKPVSLMDLPQTQYGGFVLKPGFYEAEFKTYCLQPGTPDPHEGDAYLQGPITGYRKEIVESVLLNSRDKNNLDQRNVQLLLWSIVSGADFNKLSYEVQADARQLLTSKQIFELKGGVMGVIKNVSYTSGILNANKGIQGLFNTGVSSYESFERLAVRREQSKVVKKNVKYDQWYKQQENYYVRYFPVSYKKVRIQIYVPDSLLDADNKLNGEYLVFDPTGQQAIPAFTNAQRLGIGAPVIGILRTVIKVNKQTTPQKKIPENPKTPKNPKKGV